MSTLADVIQKGTDAGKPAASIEGLLYCATDTKKIYRDSGASLEAVVDVMTGDSGAGGVRGLVPAPGAGDAAANKYLKADGTWVEPPGAGDVTGPGSATDADFVQFDGAGGKTIKDGGLALDTDGTMAANSDVKIPSQKAVKTYADTKIAASTKGAASGVASLNGSTLVVENPANATATPTASKIPIADGSGKLDGWVSGGGGPSAQSADLGPSGSNTRAVTTVYQNTGTKPLYVSVMIAAHDATKMTADLQVAAANPPTTRISWGQGNLTDDLVNLSGFVLPNYYYRVNVTAGTADLYTWVEFS